VVFQKHTAHTHCKQAVKYALIKGYSILFIRSSSSKYVWSSQSESRGDTDGPHLL